MKTIRIKIYKFDELSKDAQQTAINDFLTSGIDTDFIYSDAYNTVKAFNEAFRLEEGRNSWLDCNTSHLEYEILNLRGFRLRKYIINNFWNDLYKRQYIKSYFTENEPKKYNPYRKYKTFYSAKENKNGFWITLRKKMFFDNSCVLTGFCYDDCMLDPIYTFLNSKNLNAIKYTTFEILLNDCFDSLKKSIDSEIREMQTDEYIKDMILANEYDFLKDGKIYY